MSFCFFVDWRPDDGKQGIGVSEVRWRPLRLQTLPPCVALAIVVPLVNHHADLPVQVVALGADENDLTSQYVTGSLYLHVYRLSLATELNLLLVEATAATILAAAGNEADAGV